MRKKNHLPLIFAAAGDTAPEAIPLNFSVRAPFLCLETVYLGVSERLQAWLRELPEIGHKLILGGDSGGNCRLPSAKVVRQGYTLTRQGVTLTHSACLLRGYVYLDILTIVLLVGSYFWAPQFNGSPKTWYVRGGTTVRGAAVSTCAPC